MGVSGSGKSTIGQILADRLGWAYLEGDEFHPPENIAKMASSVPLTEADRAPWIDALRSEIVRLERKGQNGILASSALTESLRRRLAGDSTQVRFVYLKGSPALIAARLKNRRGHFFSADLLASQFEALEEPSDAIAVEISQTPAAIADEILHALGLGQDAAGAAD